MKRKKEPEGQLEFRILMPPLARPHVLTAIVSSDCAVIGKIRGAGLALTEAKLLRIL